MKDKKIVVNGGTNDRDFTVGTSTEFLLNPQVRTCSIAAPGTSRNNNSENRKPTGDRSLDNPCPEVVFSASHTSTLNDSEQEETHHNNQLNLLIEDLI